MRPVLDRQQIRSFDARWIAAGVPGSLLMENAGRGAAHLIGLKLRPRSEAPQPKRALRGSCIRCADERALLGSLVLILCGSGNNGGDGFVVARHLLARGAQVRILCIVSLGDLRGDAKIAAQALLALNHRIEPLSMTDELVALIDEADLVVDALLGTGADRAVQGELLRCIESLNRSSTPVIALDIPSGLDAETGAILGQCVKATHTVTFAHLKRGLLTTFGHEHCGTITVSHIGVPNSLGVEEAPSAWLVEEEDLPSLLRRRSPTTHKSSAGRVVIVAGSPGMTGAARLVGRASLRAGAGLVTLCGDAATVEKLDSEVMELMTHPWGKDEDRVLLRADVVVVGPGLGRGELASNGIRRALNTSSPTVLDADALRWLAAAGAEDRALLSSPERIVLTPHAGEAAALLDCEIAQVEADRFAAVQTLAKKFRCTVVLKGSRSLIAAPGEIPLICALGSPSLGTAGSGDVLSGILGALLVGARDAHEVFRCTTLAVGVHALAGQLWSEENGDRGLLASEIAELVPKILRNWQ